MRRSSKKTPTAPVRTLTPPTVTLSEADEKALAANRKLHEKEIALTQRRNEIRKKLRRRQEIVGVGAAVGPDEVGTLLDTDMVSLRGELSVINRKLEQIAELKRTMGTQIRSIQRTIVKQKSQQLNAQLMAFALAEVAPPLRELVAALDRFKELELQGIEYVGRGNPYAVITFDRGNLNRNRLRAVLEMIEGWTDNATS